jgi:hypothetical protein
LQENPVSNPFLAGLAAALVAATFPFGQVQAQPAPGDVTVPAPSARTVEEPLSLYSLFFPATGGRRVISTEADYVLWFVAGSKGSVPISTTLPGLAAIGELGDVQQQASLGSGGRFSIGYWIVEDSPWVPQGIRDRGGEANFFFVGRRSVDLNTDVPPTLFRPFFDLNNRVDSGFLVAAPGIATGSINAHAQLEFWGAEANVWKNVYFDSPGTSCLIDLMAGFRYVNATSELDISSVSNYNQVIPAGSPFFPFAGNQLQVMDSFLARNNFYGGQMGISVRSLPSDDELSFEGSLRIALGNTSEDITINGSQLRTFANGTVAAANGGLLALPSNIGNHHLNQFSQIPEVMVKLGYPVGRHLRLSFGFSALFWTNILRPAAQVDRSIDISQIPNDPLAAGATPTGLAHPGVPFKQSDVWLLGLNFGLEYRW